ncbi:MAG: hypothetical protein U5L96_16365 [Owenweeksia sp.]|nr:hypothetical protein [Owenweeksia sp.]
MAIEDLREAVPDYYHFEEGLLTLKLINPENYNEYGATVQAPYRLVNEKRIVLLDPNTGEQKDKWDVIYLDANYLALDMGDLRVFFTHTTPQE